MGPTITHKVQLGIQSQAARFKFWLTHHKTIGKLYSPCVSPFPDLQHIILIIYVIRLLGGLSEILLFGSKWNRNHLKYLALSKHTFLWSPLLSGGYWVAIQTLRCGLCPHKLYSGFREQLVLSMTRNEFFLFYHIFSNKVPSNNQENFQEATQLVASLFERPSIKEGDCGEGINTDLAPRPSLLRAMGEFWAEPSSPWAWFPPALQKGRAFSTRLMKFTVTVPFCD